MFRKTTRFIVIDSFWLSPELSAVDFVIPAHFLAAHSITNSLVLTCAGLSKNRTSLTKVSIHPDAFSASRFSLQTIYSNDCDLDSLDFLSGFYNLTGFYFNFPSVYKKGGRRPGYPMASALSRPLLPLLSAKLEDAIFGGVGFGDEVADLIVLWLLQSSSETLRWLSMVDANMIRSPRNVSSFKQLTEFYW